MHRTRGGQLNETGDLLDRVRDLIAPLPTPLELAGDYAVCGDVHVPYTDWALALRLGAVARKELKRPRRLIVAGDFWNYDAYSHYPPTMVIPTWQTEKRAGRELAKEWARTFDEIYFLMGNHERRKQKWTAGQEDDEDIFSPLASVAKIKSSAYGWAVVHSGGKAWRVTHPRNYSINPLVVASELAQKFDANVITFHQHHLAIGPDRYCRHIVVDGGCLVDPHKLGYVTLDDNKAPGMARGFVVLRGGIATIYGDGITEWGRYEPR